MNLDYIVKLIEDKVIVNRCDIVEAKMYIHAKNLNEFNVNDLLSEYLKDNGISKPNMIEFETVDTLNVQIGSISDYYRKAIGFLEAIIQLVSSNIYLNVSEEYTSPVTGLRVTSNGFSSSIELNKFRFRVPSLLIKSFYQRDTNSCFEEDIYLDNLNIEIAHCEVKEAIIDSLKCFNSNLYQPSVVMLGKAIEGAWIELGIAMLNWNKSSENEKKIEKLKGIDGFARKMKDILKYYSNKPIYESIYKSSDIKYCMLQETAVWSNLVRESRNAIHFGVSPSVPNSYEKVSTLLLAATTHFRIIYKLIGVFNDSGSQIELRITT